MWSGGPSSWWSCAWLPSFECTCRPRTWTTGQRGGDRMGGFSKLGHGCPSSPELIMTLQFWPRLGPCVQNLGRVKVLTIGRRCSRASPVSEPTARLMANWRTSWNALVQDVHRSITIPISAARVTTTLARVAYKYSKERRRNLLELLQKINKNE